MQDKFFLAVIQANEKQPLECLLAHAQQYIQEMKTNQCLEGNR
jgi:hypothetical protein